MLKKHVGARALLIQDARDVALLIRSLIFRLPDHLRKQITLAMVPNIIEWSIREELGLTYLIEIEGHYRVEPYRSIYAELRNLTEQCLGPIIASKITVPKLRLPEATFMVTFYDDDVYIWYYD